MGTIIGLLSITSKSTPDRFGHKRWCYICACGKSGALNESALRTKNKRLPKSCGCALVNSANFVNEIGERSSNCCRCKRLFIRTADNFAPYKKSVDGLSRICRTCQYELNAEWRKNNPDRMKENTLAWRKRNKEKEQTRLRIARLNNPQACRDRVRKSYWKNVEKRRADRRIYGKNNPEKESEHAATRRARKMSATIGPVDYRFILQRDAGICHICKLAVNPKERSFDHIIPLCRGGEHSNGNIALAHLKCNLSKGSKMPVMELD